MLEFFFASSSITYYLIVNEFQSNFKVVPYITKISIERGLNRFKILLLVLLSPGSSNSQMPERPTMIGIW